VSVLIVKGPADSGARIIELLTLTIFDFDATTKEAHTHDVDWTMNPVESGIDVTDHAVLKPEELSLSGIVTDTPIGGLPPLPGRAQSAFDTLLRLRDSKRLVTVVTGLQVYTDMGITSVKVSRDKNTGQSIRPEVSFRKIRKVASIEIEIPPELLKPAVKPGAQSPVDAGVQPPEDIPIAVVDSEDAIALEMWEDKAGSTAANIMDKWPF
jgi:hypothetical protein